MEYWFDPRHTGALRIIDYNKRIIYGSDPNEPMWSVTFEKVTDDAIKVDFTNKKTHHGKTVMIAKYSNRRNDLNWPDTNRWLRLRQDPRILLKKFM